jgi:hypothetical protein
MICLKTLALIVILLILLFTVLKKKERYQACTQTGDCPRCPVDQTRRCIQGKCRCLLFD